jgi:DNA-binding beta-propeller fold protein YncE
MWVTCFDANSVYRLRAKDGAPRGIFPVQNNPTGIGFDGANVWVANYGSNSVSKISINPRTDADPLR